MEPPIIKAYVELMRPVQWMKNFFIFLPLFFGGRLFDGAVWVQGLLCFAAFSLVASSVYCLNDIHDAAADRTHPLKCGRPIASGRVRVKCAWTLCCLLAAAGLAIPWLFIRYDPFVTLCVIVGYLLMNVAYTFRLKQMPIIDVFVIAFGFVLRLVSGGLSENVPLSPWIVLLTFLLALFLAFAKRRDDVLRTEESGVVARSSTRSYNREFLNTILGIIASVTMVCYIMYTLSPEVIERFHNSYIYVSAVFMLAGMIRYLQIAIVLRKSGSPTKVLAHDRFVQGCIVMWVLFFLVIIYR